MTLVRLIVTVLLANRLPPSVTWTVRLKEGVVSRSSLVVSATVMIPSLLMSKAPELLPAVIVNTWVSPASTSLATTVPTVTVLAVFSAMENVCGAIVGVSLTAVTLMVMVAATVPLPVSFTMKSNALRAAPFALPAGV